MLNIQYVAFREMPGHRPNGFRVPLAPRDPLVEATDVAARRAPACEADRVRRFDERPLEVAGDIWTRGTESSLPAARVDARRRARIAGQLLGRRKPRDIAHLERDHDRERQSHPRQREQP